jgi:hypothetical protein
VFIVFKNVTESVSEVLDEEGFTIGVNIIYVHGFSEDVV